MGHARRAPQHEVPFEFTLLSNGGAELTRSGVQIWASDSDDDFAEEFGDEFLDENDTEAVLEYLVEAGHLTDDDADNAEVFTETAEPVGPGDEEDEEGRLMDPTAADVRAGTATYDANTGTYTWLPGQGPANQGDFGISDTVVTITAPPAAASTDHSVLWLLLAAGAAIWMMES